MTEKEVLEALHTAIANELVDRIKSGGSTAADLAVAVKFLKDNGISAILAPDSPVANLMKNLPFDTEATVN